MTDQEFERELADQMAVDSPGKKKKGKFLKKRLTTGRKSAILALALFEGRDTAA